MAARKKKPAKTVRVVFEAKGGQWLGKGAHVRVTGPTLRSARLRAKAAVQEQHGESAEMRVELVIPEAFRERVERNKAERARLRKAREDLRVETAALVEAFRSELAVSYADVGALLDVAPSMLMRTVYGQSSDGDDEV